jgi:hypothetical protein
MRIMNDSGYLPIVILIYDMFYKLCHCVGLLLVILPSNMVYSIVKVNSNIKMAPIS